MIKYILKRCIMVIPVLLGATFMVFTIMEFTPGDPALIILGTNATDAEIDNLREEMGLNEPFLMRYGKFVLNLVRGDMGTSYRNSLQVSKLIGERLMNTLILATAAVCLAIVIGIPVGIVSAIKQYTLFDNIVMVVSLVMAAAPVFWLGLLLVIVFALNFGMFPAAGMGVGFPKMLISLVLPMITLSGNTTAIIARTTRSSMLEVVRQDYVDTARAKGLNESTVTVRHMLKNALIPIVTVVGLNFGGLLGGSVLTESIFAWPGVGRFVVESITAKDTPAVLASVVTLAILFTFVNLFVDILYAFVDPRIKSQYQTARRGTR